MITLKKCPFCGGDAKIIVDGLHASIKCEICSASPFSVSLTHKDVGQNLLQMIDLWNSRVETNASETSSTMPEDKC